MIAIIILFALTSCTTDTIVDRVDNYPVNERKVTADTTDSAADTTRVLYPIEFGVTIKDWE